MKHFQTMTEAVRAASKLCPGWLVLESGEYIEAEAALYIAQVTDRLDNEDDRDEEIYYLTSDEGAVGVTSKYEYLAQWILMPMMRSMAEIEAELTAEIGRRQAEQQDTPARTTSFCSYCGSRLKPGAKFCTECGSKLG